MFNRKYKIKFKSIYLFNNEFNNREKFKVIRNNIMKRKISMWFLNC